MVIGHSPIDNHPRLCYESISRLYFFLQRLKMAKVGKNMLDMRKKAMNLILIKNVQVLRKSKFLITQSRQGKGIKG